MIRIIIEIDGQQMQLVPAAPGPQRAASEMPTQPAPAGAAPLHAVEGHLTAAPAAAPAAASAPVPPGDLAHGKQVFFDLLTAWLAGYGDPEAPQPDRPLRMGKVFQVRKDALGLKAYLEHHRALETAILDCYPSMDMLRATDVAANMAQVASAMQFPLIPRIYYEGVGIRANPEAGANP